MAIEEITEIEAIESIKAFAKKEINRKTNIAEYEGKKKKLIQKALSKIDVEDFKHIAYLEAVKRLFKDMVKEGITDIDGYSYFQKDGKFYRDKL